MNRARAYHRIFANIFDFIVCAAACLLVTFRSITALVSALMNPSGLDSVALYMSSFGAGALSLILIIFYFIALPIYWNGQTLGKRFFKIKIMKNDGAEIDFKTIFLREMVRILLFILSFGASTFADTIVLLFSKQRVGFYDYIASTCVVDVD